MQFLANETLSARPFRKTCLSRHVNIENACFILLLSRLRFVKSSQIFQPTALLWRRFELHILCFDSRAVVYIGRQLSDTPRRLSPRKEFFKVEKTKSTIVGGVSLNSVDKRWFEMEDAFLYTLDMVCSGRIASGMQKAAKSDFSFFDGERFNQNPIS